MGGGIREQAGLPVGEHAFEQGEEVGQGEEDEGVPGGDDFVLRRAGGGHRAQFDRDGAVQRDGHGSGGILGRCGTMGMGHGVFITNRHD